MSSGASVGTSPRGARVAAFHGHPVSEGPAAHPSSAEVFTRASEGRADIAQEEVPATLGLISVGLLAAGRGVLEGGLRHNFDLKAPAVVAIQTGINTPRFATMKMVKQAKQKPLVVVSGAGVVDGSGGYVVKRMYIPEQSKAEMLTGTPAEIAKFIANLIREKKG